MAKVVPSTIQGAYASTAELNANFAALAAEFENCVSLDGATPSAMASDFDMNGNDILNAGAINASGVTVGGTDMTVQAAAAEASATAASSSETNAASSETAAAASAASIAANVSDYFNLWLDYGSNWTTTSAASPGVKTPLVVNIAPPTVDHKVHITASIAGTHSAADKHLLFQLYKDDVLVSGYGFSTYISKATGGRQVSAVTYIIEPASTDSAEYSLYCYGSGAGTTTLEGHNSAGCHLAAFTLL